MAHQHHPNGKGPVCRFATKRECDEFMRDHRRAERAAYEERQRQKAEDKRLAFERAVAEYEAREAARIAAALEEQHGNRTLAA